MLNRSRSSPLSESKFATEVLIFITVLFLGLFVILPLLTVFGEAFRHGLGPFVDAIIDPDALKSIKLTLFIAVLVVPLNLLFGLCAAWVITKFQFRGKTFLITLIDIPFSVSPVIVGFVYLLLLGVETTLGQWFMDHGIQVIYAIPGMVMVTTFVTLPFIVRELIPVMLEQGTREEETALSLGADGMKTFLLVTLPNVKWSLVYGVLLCNARAMGEFGAVFVVSGHIRGYTDTMPLHVEAMYNDFNFVASFAVASLLTAMAIVTLLLRLVVERFLGAKEIKQKKV